MRGLRLDCGKLDFQTQTRSSIIVPFLTLNIVSLMLFYYHFHDLLLLNFIFDSLSGMCHVRLNSINLFCIFKLDIFHHSSFFFIHFYPP